MNTAETLNRSEFLNGVRLICGRELAACFDSKIAYVYAAAFILLANSIFMNDFFLAGTADMSGYFELLPLLLAFFLPAITTRLWAEEHKHRTIELLLTMPIVPVQAILGKYLAAMAIYLLFLAGSLPIVLMLLVLGHPDVGRIAAGYLGLVLFGCQFLALGMFFSALSSEQIVAFVTSVLVSFGLVLTGMDRVVAVLDGLFPRLLLGSFVRESISVMPHYEAFTRGILVCQPSSTSWRPALCSFGSTPLCWTRQTANEISGPAGH